MAMRRLIHVFSRIDCLWHWLWIGPGVVVAGFTGIGLCFGPGVPFPPGPPSIPVVPPTSFCCLPPLWGMPPPWSPAIAQTPPDAAWGGGGGVVYSPAPLVTIAGLEDGWWFDREAVPRRLASVSEPSGLLFFVLALLVGFLSRHNVVSTGPIRMKRS